MLSNWHKTRSNLRLILVYKKPYELDKSLNTLVPGESRLVFDRYLPQQLHMKFSHSAVAVELLTWQKNKRNVYVHWELNPDPPGGSGKC